MKIRSIILIILILIFFVSKNYKLNIEEKPRILKSYKNNFEKININNLLNGEKIIKELKISRNNFSLLNIKKDFSVDYIEKDLEISYINLEDENDYQENKYHFFEEYLINLDEIWSNKEKFQKLDSEKIYFSGMMNTNKEKIAYLYFYNNLISVKENEYLGDKKILKIYKNGILLINSNNQFEVIM